MVPSKVGTLKVFFNVFFSYNKVFTKGKRPKKLKVEFCLSEPSGGTIIKILLAIREFLCFFGSGSEGLIIFHLWAFLWWDKIFVEQPKKCIRDLLKEKAQKI